MSKKVLAIISLYIILLSILRPNLIGISKSQKIQATTIGLPTNMPAIYIEPSNISVSPGETFNVSLRIFNLTNSFWQTNTQWMRGDDLGPWANYPLYNYSLGNLMGVAVQLGWDETVLKFVNNVTKIPVETHPDGILHQPILKVKDEVNETHGFPYPQPEESKYWLAYISFLGPSFNGNGTVCKLTFEVLKEGASNLTLTRTQLADPNGEAIPHKFISAFFKSPGARTRLGEIDVGVFAGGEHLSPVLVGEDVNVSVQVRNDGNVTDTYNLTLSFDNEPLAVWTNETLDPGNSSIFTYILNASDLSRGVYNISSYLSLLHDGGLFNDTSSQQFRVVVPPQLAISGPSSAEGGETVVFNASGSTHLDPDGYILNYDWGLWAPSETKAQYTYEGITFTHQFHSNPKNGTWRIVLSVTDNFGVTYSESRPFSLPYTTEVPLIIPRVHPVHNLDTGLNYTSIQEAINANETLNGHTIFVDNGTYYEHIRVNKSISIIGESRESTIIDGSNIGTVVRISAPQVAVRNFTIQSSGSELGDFGIYFHNVRDVIIEENIITNTTFGIYVISSDNNTFNKNVVSNNWDAIHLLFSNNNHIIANTIENNHFGIGLIESNLNTLSNNTMIKNVYNFGVSGDSLPHFTNYVDTTNTIDGKIVYYLINLKDAVINSSTFPNIGYLAVINSTQVRIQDATLSSNRYGISLVFTNNSTITNVNITDNFHGLYTLHSDGNTFWRNRFAGNIYGFEQHSSRNNVFIGNILTGNNDAVFLVSSSNNSFVGNTIASASNRGIYLSNSNGNVIYHNNIVDSLIQIGFGDLCVNVWDNGYPSGGNYWSKYAGVDLNHDGIDDMNHTINANNVDMYPLMGPFHSFNTTLSIHANVISNSTIEDFHYFDSNSTIRMHVSNMTGNQTHGFIRICVPHNLMTEPYNVTIDGANPTYWNYTLYDNGTHRWIYFEYEHSELEVIIIPEFSLQIILPLFMIVTLLAGLIYRRKW